MEGAWDWPTRDVARADLGNSLRGSAPDILDDKQVVEVAKVGPISGNSCRQPLAEGQASRPGTKVDEVPTANWGAGVVPPLTEGVAWGLLITNKTAAPLPAKEGGVWLPPLTSTNVEFLPLPD